MNSVHPIIITGPTASGKTSKAVAVAKAIGGEIISADSRQVYRGMDLGTGKDLDEYDGVSHHLIDIADAGTKYNLYQFLTDADRAVSDITARNQVPVICGGTGLYLESFANGLLLPEVPENPTLRESLSKKPLDELKSILSKLKPLHNDTDVDSVKRAIRAIEIQTYYNDNPNLAVTTRKNPRKVTVFGLDIDREERRKRISARLDARLEAGMVEEIKNLLAKGIAPEDLIYYGLEYKFLTLYILGELTYAEMHDQLETAIHQFAKRQMTWFRGMERRGFTIHWLPYDMPGSEFVNEVITVYNSDK